MTLMFLLCLCSLVLVRPMGTPLSWHLSFFTCTHYFFLRFCLFSEKGREKEGKKHQCVVASHAPPMGDLACNPGMCPNRELNQQPLALQSCAQSTEPHLPGLISLFSKSFLTLVVSFWTKLLQKASVIYIVWNSFKINTNLLKNSACLALCELIGSSLEFLKLYL